MQEGDISPDGAPVIGFFDAKINGAGDILGMVSIDDPAIASSVDRALYRFTSDPSSGGIVTSLRVAQEGDILPGQTAALSDFGTGPHDTAILDDGTIVFLATISSGDAIYRYDGAFELIAQEGDAAPVAGRNWTSLATALDAAGDHIVYFGAMDGDSATNTLIVLDGDEFRQEGDTLSAISPYQLTSFGSGPVRVAENGDVLWYGDWDDTDTDIDTGLFVNDELLIQEGVTDVASFGIVDTIRGVEDGFDISPNGRYVIVEVEFVGGIQAALIIDRNSGPVGPLFSRGDANADGALDISDPVFLLSALFQPGAPPLSCDDAGDGNDDGGIDIADAVFLLTSLFVPGAPAPGPPEVCGTDPTADALDCADYASCP